MGRPFVKNTEHVKSMAAVSPATLLIPSMMLVAKPGVAVGNTMSFIVFHFGAPKASAATLKSFGTIFKASWEPLTIIGRVIHVSVNQPERREIPSPRNLQKNAYPNKPKVIEGTPARLFNA